MQGPPEKCSLLISFLRRRSKYSSGEEGDGTVSGSSYYVFFSVYFFIFFYFFISI